MIKRMLALLCVLFMLAATSIHAKAPRYYGKLCVNCGFGNKQEFCVKCGRWANSGYSPAGLCGNCGFGSRKDNCVKCGKWVGNTSYPARICNNCAFGNKKEYCVKCGKWAN